MILQVGCANGKVCLARIHEERMSFPRESLQHCLLNAVYTHHIVDGITDPTITARNGEWCAIPSAVKVPSVNKITLTN